jgi:hypothetical protein
MLSAFTSEIDDEKIAVGDILSQLKIDENLLADSIGIITCNSEFVETGVLKAVCSALPFSTVGFETAASGTAVEFGQLIMAVSVITSDDSEFVASISDKIEGDEENISDFCREFSKNFTEEAKIILAFCPYNSEITTIPETIFNIINDAYSGVPIFGGVAATVNDDIKNAKVIFNGDAFDDRFVISAFCGKIEPKFVVRDIPMNKVVQEKGLLTKASGNVISRINNINFYDYLLDLGFSDSLLKEHFSILPYWFDFNGQKEPIARTVFQISETGDGICSGNIPNGITMSIGMFTAKDVLDTAEKVFGDAYTGEKPNGVFFLSCLGRFIAMETDFGGEMKMLQKSFDGISCHLSYSGGGEYLSKEAEKNEYNWHNFSIMGFCF